jgi:gluconate 2-dehydrogenase gamma chain
MNRRAVLKVVALSALAPRMDALTAMCAPNSAEGTAWAAGDYELQFFSAAENHLLDQLMEMIIPADSHSGGAHAAKVSLFADRMVSTGTESGRAEWRKGLQLFQERGEKSSLAEVLASVAAGEGHPQSDLDRFFVVLKQMTVNGYYTSAIGIHQDLEYQGNTYVAQFPECTERQAQR